MELAGRRNEKVKELQAKLWKTIFCFGIALAVRIRKSGKRVGILCGNRELVTGTCRMTPALSLQRKITDNPVWKCACKTTYNMRRKRPLYRSHCQVHLHTMRATGRSWTHTRLKGRVKETAFQIHGSWRWMIVRGVLLEGVVHWDFQTIVVIHWRECMTIIYNV